VLLARFRPWTTPASFLWRFVVRPGVLALGALGGLDVVRSWLNRVVD
jgi:hypothetical protein